MALSITKTRTSSPKTKPDQSNLGFCRYFTDHMFTMDYTPEKGWHNRQIVPYGPLHLDPSCAVFHYGQEIFEGLKAYRAGNGDILLFRPEQNAMRLNASHERLCMPPIPVEEFVECVKAIVEFDKDWIPTAPETSLYIRPFTIATDTVLGVHPSATYKFVIILSPAGSYYPTGFNPVRILVEDEYVRAVMGGTGSAKCGGNYAGSMLGQHKASEKGYSQVLWLDGLERKYVEEGGAMNIMFKIDGEIITPPADGSILPGITRKSCIDILRDWGMKVSERKLSIDEIVKAHDEGKLEEIFCTGTAAVISPVSAIGYKGKDYVAGDGNVGPVTKKLYDELTGIQWGRIDDIRGWTVKL